MRDTPLDESSKNLLDPGNASKSGSGSSKEYPWSSAAKSQAYAELALQVMASFVLGRVVHFGVRNGFYIIGSATYKELPPAARLMYGGALFYLITASMMVLVEILFIIGSYSDNSSERREMWKPGALLFIFGNLATTWLASWLFWTGCLAEVRVPSKGRMRVVSSRIVTKTNKPRKKKKKRVLGGDDG